MQTALHIRELVHQLNQEVNSGKVVATEFYKKERAAYLFIRKGKNTSAFGFVYHPSGYGQFLVPASKINITTREKPWPIFDIVEAIVTQVEQIGMDRIIRIKLEKESETIFLECEAHGPNGNIWLLDQNLCQQATLRNRKYTVGEKHSPPTAPAGLDPFKLTSVTFRTQLHKSKDQSLIQFLEKNILGFNRTIARDITKRADLEYVAISELDDTTIDKLVKIVTEITSRFETGGMGYLYRTPSSCEVYPFKLASESSLPEKYKTLSLAVMQMISTRQETSVKQDEKKLVTDAVRRAIKKLERRLVKIEKDIKQASDFEHFRKVAELIQINMKSIKKGKTEVIVEDVYSDPANKITITLEPALSPADNAEAYFKKYRKGREGLELLQRRLEVSRSELDQWQTIKGDLENNFESGLESYHQEIQSLLPKEGVKSDVVVRLPYREFVLSTGVKIFVGRDGSDNDRTTFEFARPYELWFHTQQCAGSHVVIKYPNKSFEPSKQEIEETASVAAYYSKAKNDSLVPIIYTQRRYVRKPRKAKPGLVMVEREKSVMVPPRKPD